VLRQAVSDQDELICQQGGRINDLDQYSRRNNTIIAGIPETRDKNETSTETTLKDITTLNDKFKDIDIKMSDIDISHRLGRIQTDRPRPIVVRFVWRVVRNEVMYRRRELKGTKIFINDDLSHLNRFMLVNIKTMISANEAVWTRDGTLYHKDNNGKIRAIPHSEYKQWFGLDKLSYYHKPEKGNNAAFMACSVNPSPIYSERFPRGTTNNHEQR